MRSFDPKEHPVPLIHQILLGGVAPRPIALVSTIDEEGRCNLSPFSFFNAFGANPPVVVVSPSFRGTTGAAKHTYENIIATGMFTVSAVSYAMVHQINLASAEYPRGVDEFVMAGLTKLPSALVAPPGVAESPFVMECRLMHHIGTGGLPASGNLMIGEVVMFHVHESAFENDRIHPDRLDLVGRLGQNYYVRASGAALFELAKPRATGMGMDALPQHLRHSVVLTGNELAQLAAIGSIPDAVAIEQRWRADIERVPRDVPGTDDFDVEARLGHPREALYNAMLGLRIDPSRHALFSMRLVRCVQLFLAAHNVDMAWECALMSDDRIVARIAEAAAAR